MCEHLNIPARSRDRKPSVIRDKYLGKMSWQRSLVIERRNQTTISAQPIRTRVRSAVGSRSHGMASTMIACTMTRAQTRSRTPPQYGRAARAVTITLPEDVLARLATVFMPIWDAPS